MENFFSETAQIYSEYNKNEQIKCKRNGGKKGCEANKIERQYE